jgi:hypothetical protein
MINYEFSNQYYRKKIKALSDQIELMAKEIALLRYQLEFVKNNPQNPEIPPKKSILFPW